MRIVITGLPGSGKTYLGHALSQEHGLPFYDDATHLPDHDGFIITHPMFCKPTVLNTILTTIETKWGAATLISFENNRIQALKNARTRKRRVDGLIDSLSQVYIPQGTIHPIWQDNA